MSSNGFAFIKDTNNPEIREVFISKSLTEYAINGDLVKVLGRGKIDVPVNVTAHKFSTSAENSIEKAGGKTTKI